MESATTANMAATTERVTTATPVAATTAAATMARGEHRSGCRERSREGRNGKNLTSDLVTHDEPHLTSRASVARLWT
jgi:hypothetical protein